VILALACSVVPPADSEACDPRFLDPTEVRAKEIRCGDEVPSGGEGRTGDLLLQNAHVVAVVRPYASLTWAGHGGGGLIDLAPAGGLDTVLEVVPLLAGGWFTMDDVSWGSDAASAWVTLTGVSTAVDFLGGTEGEPVELTWRLPVDGFGVDVEGSDELYVHGLLGEVTETGLWWDDRTLGVVGELAEDLGGARVHRSSELLVGSAADVHEVLFADGVHASGRCEGGSVAVWSDDEVVARLPGSFAVRVPIDSELVCEVPAHAAGEPTAPGLDLTLEPGAAGGLDLRVEDERGEALPALAWVDGEPYAVAPTGAPLALPPGSYDLVVEHGPAFGTWEGTVEVPGAMDVLLERELSEGWITVDLGRETWPSRTSRLDPGVDLQRAIGEGHVLVVQHARGEVAQPEHADWTAHHARVLAGSLTEGPASIVSWPWSSNSKKPGHGAADAVGLDALDRLAVAQGGEVTDRLTVVGLDWVDEAPEVHAWRPEPAVLELDGVDSADRVMALLDAGFRPAFSGPVTWSAADTTELPSVAASERGLASAATSAGTGPRLVLERDPRLGWPKVGLTLSLEQGSSGRLRTVEVWTDGGLVASYDVDGVGEVLREDLIIPPGVWAWALGWSDTDWAVSAALWTGSGDWEHDPPLEPGSLR